MLWMVFSQILTSWRSTPRKNYKSWQRFCKKKLDFKGIKFPVKIIGIYEIENKDSIGISVLGYENKVRYRKILKKNV